MSLHSAAKVFIVAVLVVLTVLIIGFFLVRYAWGSLPGFLKDFFGYFIGYNRGVGRLPDCGGEQYQAGLCYPYCPAGYYGVGLYCWQSCPDGMKNVGVACQKGTHKRGWGSLPGCPPGQDYDAGLCYPQCPAGYNGVGPYCWQECPPGFKDTGVDCLKPPAYTRGTGHETQAYCEQVEKKPCEKCLSLWYPKCDVGFHSSGWWCYACSPDCPDGMKDVGISCQKNDRLRGGASFPKWCPPGQEYDAGFCYPTCPPGYYGVGPLCWQSCPPGMRDSGADCLKNTKYRGGATIPASCPAGQEKDAGLCYEVCDPGYKGVAFMCWADWASYL